MQDLQPHQLQLVSRQLRYIQTREGSHRAISSRMVNRTAVGEADDLRPGWYLTGGEAGELPGH